MRRRDEGSHVGGRADNLPRRAQKRIIEGGGEKCLPAKEEKCADHLDRVQLGRDAVSARTCVKDSCLRSHNECTWVHLYLLIVYRYLPVRTRSINQDPSAYRLVQSMSGAATHRQEQPHPYAGMSPDGYTTLPVKPPAKYNLYGSSEAPEHPAHPHHRSVTVPVIRSIPS